jgi:hypothetical protein
MREMTTNVHNSLKSLVGAPRFELGTSCAQGRRATRLRYAPTMTALFILKHFPTLLLIRLVIFGLTVPKLCQILLLNRGYARIQRHLIGLAVHLLQGLSLHLLHVLASVPILMTVGNRAQAAKRSFRSLQCTAPECPRQTPAGQTAIHGRAVDFDQRYTSCGRSEYC